MSPFHHGRSSEEEESIFPSSSLLANSSFPFPPLLSLFSLLFPSLFFSPPPSLLPPQCQQCKLHAKVSLLGYGTSLKLLFLDEDMYEESITKNEVIAFVNVLHTMSESIESLKTLTALYWADHDVLLQPPVVGEGVNLDSDELMDACVGCAKRCEEEGLVNGEREAELVELCLGRSPEIMVLVKHYGNELEKFSKFSTKVDSSTSSSSSSSSSSPPPPDAIVVGTGLAGLSATLSILDRGGRVLLIEKETRIGGNSAKASSGINGCCPHNDTHGDSAELFKNDTMRSAGARAQEDLVEVLVEGSGDAISWLKQRVGVDLSQVAQVRKREEEKRERERRARVCWKSRHSHSSSRPCFSCPLPPLVPFPPSLLLPLTLLLFQR